VVVDILERDCDISGEPVGQIFNQIQVHCSSSASQDHQSSSDHRVWPQMPEKSLNPLLIRWRTNLQIGNWI